MAPPENSPPPPSCVEDALSVVGLDALVREHPKDWKVRLRAVTRPDLSKDATVEVALRAGLFDGLFPTEACITSAGVEKKRAIAAHLVRCAGAVTLLEIDESFIERVEAGVLAESRPDGKPYGRSRAMSVGNVLRRLAWAYQVLAGEPARVMQPRHAKGIRPGLRRESRTGIHPRLLRRLVGQAPALLRAMIVFTAGCGLLEGEALRLRVRHLKEYARVSVVGGGVRGRPGLVANRQAFVPAWGVPYLEEAFTDLSAQDPDAFLFPHRFDRARHRTSFLYELEAVAGRVGIPTPIGFMDLVDLHRALCKKGRVPRALARGTHVDGVNGEDTAGYHALRRLAEAWTQVDEPPGGLLDARSLRVARKGPRWVRGDEPESTRRRESRAHLRAGRAAPDGRPPPKPVAPATPPTAAARAPTCRQEGASRKVPSGPAQVKRRAPEKSPARPQSAGKVAPALPARSGDFAPIPLLDALKPKAAQPVSEAFKAIGLLDSLEYELDGAKGSPRPRAKKRTR